MKKLILILPAVLLVVGGSVYWFVIRDNNVKEDTNKTTKTLTTSEVLTKVLITFNNDGFYPNKYLAGIGASLTIQNDSSSALDFESDDHPTHTKNTELNVGVIVPGESKTIKLTTAGTWGFHNHNNPAQTGTITIE
jgi:hypothetical protein